MTRAAALELAQYGIRVNTICPGDTDTPMIRGLRRPEEISAAVVFLASDEFSYMGGSDVVVDGAYNQRIRSSAGRKGKDRGFR